MTQRIVVIATVGALLAGVGAGCGDDTKTVIERTVEVTKTQGPTPPPQPAMTIELGRGIGGVTIGMSTEQVKQVLGQPSSTKTNPHPIAGHLLSYTYSNGMTVDFYDASAIAIATTSQGARTSSGVGVGSTEQDVRALPDFAGCQTAGAQTVCRVGRAQAGGQITNQFTVVDGRVTQVMVARVID